MRRRFTLAATVFALVSVTGCGDGMYRDWRFREEIASAQVAVEQDPRTASRAFAFRLLEPKGTGEPAVIEEGTFTFDTPECFAADGSDRKDPEIRCNSRLASDPPESTRDIWPLDDTRMTLRIEPATNTIRWLEVSKNKYEVLEESVTGDLMLDCGVGLLGEGGNYAIDEPDENGVYRVDCDSEPTAAKHGKHFSVVFELTPLE